MRDVYHNMLTESPGKGPKTGILSSIASHKIPTVEFDFAAISVTICDGMLLRCLLRSMLRELRARVFLDPDRPGPDQVQTRTRPGPKSGPTTPRPGVFFTNIQHSGCRWTYRDHGLTSYNWLLGEKDRYTIVSCYSFLTINASKTKSFRLVEKRRIKVLYMNVSSAVFRFQAKIKLGLVRTNDASGSEKKVFRLRHGSGHGRSSLSVMGRYRGFCYGL